MLHLGKTHTSGKKLCGQKIVLLLSSHELTFSWIINGVGMDVLIDNTPWEIDKAFDLVGAPI